MSPAASTLIFMFASWCWIAWKRPIGWPNCSRFLACSRASSNALRAIAEYRVATMMRSMSRLIHMCAQPLPTPSG